MVGTRPRVPAWLVPSLIIIVESAFLPVMGNGFVNWDDPANFIYNNDFRGFGGPQIRWAWSTFLLGVYQPLAWMVLEVQYVVWGLDPRGYHLVSLVMHLINTIVLFHLTYCLLTRCSAASIREGRTEIVVASAIASAVFALHPLRVEVVAWASCQPYLLCALLTMLSVLAYLRAVAIEPRSVRWFLASVSLFTAAVLSKAAAVALPAVLLILDFYPLQRLGWTIGGKTGPNARKVLMEKVPFVAISMSCAALALEAKVHAVVFSLQGTDGIYSRVAQACYATLFYICKTLAPVELSAFYPSPERVPFSDPRFFLSIAVVFCVSLATFAVRRRLPGIFAAWYCYVVLLAPSSGIVRISRQIAADRYSYIASVSWIVLLAFGLSRILRADRDVRRATALSFLVLILLARLTWQQCLTWRSSAALWENALASGAHEVPEVYYNLSSAILSERRDHVRAVELLCASRDRLLVLLARNPNDVIYNNVIDNTYNNIGMIFLETHRPEDALVAFESAARHQKAAMKIASNKAIVRGNLVDHLLNVCKANRALNRTDMASDAAWELRDICAGEPIGLFMAARAQAMVIPLVGGRGTQLDESDRGKRNLYTERTVTMLKLSWEAGFRDMNAIMTDDVFEPRVKESLLAELGPDYSRQKP
jgi:hypothetical protein